ncbi:MAG TPA: MlaD family protein, partial [Verrucomicrobiae bacterium]
MAGVQIGNVTGVDLAPDGRTVVLTLKIQKQYELHRDARFGIEQAGLLGDQFVAIVATENKGPMLREGDEVMTAPSSDFKEMLRSAAGLIQKLDETVSTLQTAVGRVDKLLVNEANLTSIARAVTNFEGFSLRAGGTLERLDGLVTSNAPTVNTALTNFARFSQQMKELGNELNSVVATNKDEVARALKNLESATASANQVLDDLKAGKGLAGGLLRDDSMKRDLGDFVTNLTTVSSNLKVTTSNLNEHGLWWMLWSHEARPARTNPPGAYTGRTPFK